MSLRYRSEYRSDSPPKPEILPISQSRACAKTSYTLRACSSQPGLLSGNLVVASETYEQLEAQQHHASTCRFGYRFEQAVLRWPKIAHFPNDPKKCFRRSKITFGYGSACRLWRLRVQARSMSSRKESNRWPRMQFTPRVIRKGAKITFGYGLALPATSK